MWTLADGLLVAFLFVSVQALGSRNSLAFKSNLTTNDELKTPR